MNGGAKKSARGEGGGAWTKRKKKNAQGKPRQKTKDTPRGGEKDFKEKRSGIIDGARKRNRGLHRTRQIVLGHKRGGPVSNKEKCFEKKGKKSEGGLGKRVLKGLKRRLIVLRGPRQRSCSLEKATRGSDVRPKKGGYVKKRRGNGARKDRPENVREGLTRDN